MADSLRGLADVAIPGSVIALGVLAAPTLPRRGWIVGAVTGFAFIVIRLSWPLATREITQAITDLWLTTLPDAAQIALIAIAVSAVVIVPFDRRTRGATPSLALLLGGGVMPDRNEALLVNFLAALALLAWAQGRIKRAGGLAELLG